jgi:hypothetical protein
MNAFPTIRLIQTLEHEKQVLQSAKEDNHSNMYPTHVIERHGEIIGASSIARVPLLLVWHHSKKVSAKDSMHLKLVYDSIMETKGFPRYFIACDETSPYNSHMIKLGYKTICKTQIFEGGV